MEIELTKEQCEQIILDNVVGRISCELNEVIKVDRWKDHNEPSGIVLKVVKRKGE